MKICILGTNGFLSNAIGKYANEHGWHLDMYGLAAPDSVRYDKFIEINLMDRDLDCTTMIDSDIIVYAIGAGIQSNLMEGADLLYALNVTAPVNICNKLKALDFRGAFVTFGSYFELGETDLKHPATEEDIIKADAPAPTDYVASKRMLTRFVTSYKHEFTHWHFILPTIYGPGENPKRLIPYTINAIRNNEELHFTSGEQVRQYLFVDDVANVLDTAYTKSLPSGIYNIAGSEEFTVRELVECIHAYFKKPVLNGCFGSTERSDTGMKYLALNNTKLTKALSIKPGTQLQDCIDKY